MDDSLWTFLLSQNSDIKKQHFKSQNSIDSFFRICFSKEICYFPDNISSLFLILTWFMNLEFFGLVEVFCLKMYTMVQWCFLNSDVFLRILIYFIITLLFLRNAQIHFLNLILFSDFFCLCPLTSFDENSEFNPMQIVFNCSLNISTEKCGLEFVFQPTGLRHVWHVFPQMISGSFFHRTKFVFQLRWFFPAPHSE